MCEPDRERDGFEFSEPQSRLNLGRQLKSATQTPCYDAATLPQLEPHSQEDPCPAYDSSHSRL